MESFFPQFITYSRIFGSDEFDARGVISSYELVEFLEMLSICFQAKQIAQRKWENNRRIPMFRFEIGELLTAEEWEIVDPMIKNEKLTLPVQTVVLSNFTILKLYGIFDQSSPSKDRPPGYIGINVLKALLKINEEYTQNMDLHNVLKYRSDGRFFYASAWAMIETENTIIKNQMVSGLLKFYLLRKWITEFHPGFLRQFESVYGFTLDVLVSSCVSVVSKLHASKDYFAWLDVDSKVAEVINVFCSDVVKENDRLDFTYIKEYPLLRLSETKYAVLFCPFLVGALNAGLYFKINSLSSKFGVKNFRTHYTEEFVEKNLLRMILERCFGDCKIHDLNLIHSIGKKADFIVQKGNKFLVVENKDNLIPREISESQNIDDISNFIENRYLKGSGLHQIANTIKNIKEFIPGFRIKYKFFPALVVSNLKLDCPAINYHVCSYWDRNFSNEIGGDVKSIISPPTIIQLDILIYYSDYLRSRKVSIFEIIASYHKNRTNWKTDGNSKLSAEENANLYFRRFESFNTYFMKFMNKSKLDVGTKWPTEFMKS